MLWSALNSAFMTSSVMSQSWAIYERRVAARKLYKSNPRVGERLAAAMVLVVML